MIYIRKRHTPKVIKDKAEEIKHTPDSGYKEIILPDDTDQLRYLFEKMPKAEIRKALHKEQHGLCAYCMGKISPDSKDMKIEHYVALSESKELALDYQNYLGVCYGGEKEKKNGSRVLCCDAARRDKQLTINPHDKRQMEAIAYQRNGEIFVRDNIGLDSDFVERMKKDIDDILCLNGERDSTGKIVSDTITKLVATRRGIYDSVANQFQRWDKEKCLTPEFLQEEIDKLEKMLESDAEALPYIGVRIYFYKRKQEKLKRRKRK